MQKEGVQNNLHEICKHLICNDSVILGWNNYNNSKFSHSNSQYYVRGLRQEVGMSG